MQISSDSEHQHGFCRGIVGHSCIPSSHVSTNIIAIDVYLDGNQSFSMAPSYRHKQIP